jgi:hypothetical protein
MNSSLNINIRKIANGYIVGRQVDCYLGVEYQGPQEQFYDSLEAVIADAGWFVKAAVEEAEATFKRAQERQEAELESLGVPSGQRMVGGF